MDYKVKSYVMFSTIFILGFMAGMLVKELITESPLEQIRTIRAPGGLMNRLEKDLDLSDNQRKEIQSILDKYDKNIQVFVQSGRSFFHSSFDSLKKEIKPYLNKDQIKKLGEEFEGPVMAPRVIRLEAGHFIDRLENNLKLTEKQKKDIGPILEKYEGEIHFEIQPGRRPFSPFDSLKEQIKPYLNKEQVKKLDEEFLPPLPPDAGFRVNTE